MPRRKQICPKRMKYDAKGQEIEDTSPDSNSPSADEQSETETSPMGSPSSPIEPLSPDDDVGMTQDGEPMEEPHDDSTELCEEGGHGRDNDPRPSKRPRIMDPITADLSLTVQTANTSLTHGPTDGKVKVSREPDDTNDLEKLPKISSDSHPSSPSSPKHISSKMLKAEASITSSKSLFPSPTPQTTLAATARNRSEEGAKSGNLEMTKVHDPCPSHQHSMDIPKLVPTPVKSCSGSDRHDKTFSKLKSDVYQDTREGDRDRHRSRHGHGGSHRKPYSDRVRDRHHLRDSIGSRRHSGESTEHSAYKSLAKKYADLFKSSTKVDIKSVKEDKSRVSYEPLKAVQDMVKAAERRSPVTPPQASYHARFDYLKRLTGSPSSLEALQRVAEKDRSISLSASTPEKRPSVVQSVSKTYSSPNYQKYLQMPPTSRDQTPPRTLDPDPDKPLDLSVKPKKKKDSPRSSSSSSSTKRSHESMSRPFLSPPPPELPASSSPSSMASTLASMEQKFGDNSFMFDRIGSKHFNTPIRQFYMSAFGMGIYSTALNNSYPFPANTPTSSSSSASVFSQSLMASNKSPVSYRSNEGQSPSRKSSVSSLPPPSEDTSKSYVPSKFLEQAMKESGIDPKRHTNLQCSCGDEFETLYHLTLHLQETGHPANKTKNGTQHDYPKLVRGQDMWLNHGSEQTKQILRCMQCGVSFKSLPELTVHMIQTKHYTNIVGSETPTKALKPPKPCLSDCSDTEYSTPHKCPKCQELFEDFAGLVRHQDKTGHLTLKCEQDLDKGDCTSPRPPSVQSDRDTTNSGATPSSSSTGSIVHFKRHLLESLNENRSHAAQDDDSRDSSFSSHSVHEMSHIRCENCADKIKTEHFVEHVRQCVKHMRSPARARSRSRSRSPVDNKFRDYFRSEFHVKRQLIKEENPNVGSQDYSSRLDQDDKYPYYRDFRSPGDDKGHLRGWTAHSQETRSKDPCPKPDSSQNTPRDFTINSSTELVKPPDTDKDGCALRAMESFIERSFSHNAVRKPAQSSSLFSTSLFARNFFASHGHQAPPRPPERNTRVDRLSPAMRRDSPSPQQENSHLYQNKYLPPLYAAPNPGATDNAQSEPSPKSPPSCPVKEEFPEAHKLVKPLENGIENPPDKNDNTVIDTSSALRKLEAFSDADKHDQDFSLSGQKKKLQSHNGHQELHEEADMKKDSTKEAVGGTKSSGSALQSLQGLVYGKSFNTEHPLDSLQKLIHTGSVTSTCHTLSSSRAVLSPSLVSSGSTTTLPGTVILVNPIVTVVSNSKGGSPSLQISLPPASPGDSKDRHSPYSDSYSNHDNKSPTLTGDGENSENRCDACNRNFASKGSYRYHQSRCHWSTVKKFRIKEAINTSPYVYLPLDHSAKFNKYYEMANELASKGK